MTIEDKKSSRRRPPYSDSIDNEDIIDTRIGRVKRHPDYVNGHILVYHHIYLILAEIVIVQVIVIAQVIVDRVMQQLVVVIERV
jgi:hypothetical protein